MNKKVYLLSTNDPDIEEEEEENNNYIQKHLEKNNINISYINNTEKISTNKNYNIFKKKGEFNLKINFNIIITQGFSLFSGCENITFIDLSNFNTELMTNFNYMFLNCYKLKEIKFGNFNTKKMAKMNFMFYGCENLKEINLEAFDTNNVEEARCLFGYCKSLVNLNLYKFDFKNLKNFEDMFIGCENLENIIVNEQLYEQIGDVLKKYNITIIYN